MVNSGTQIFSDLDVSNIFGSALNVSNNSYSIQDKTKEATIL